MFKLLALGALGYAGYKYYNRDAATGARFSGDRAKTGDIYNIDETNPAASTPSFAGTPANASPAI